VSDVCDGMYKCGVIMCYQVGGLMALENSCLFFYLFTLWLSFCAPNMPLCIRVLFSVPSFVLFVCQLPKSWFMMLENSMSVQVSNKAAREEAVWFPPGEGCTVMGRLCLLFGAVGPPLTYSRVCRYACVEGERVLEYVCIRQ
jgi:hypothetical protein